MATLAELKDLAASEQGLCVVSTTRADGSVHASVINAGPMPDPEGGDEVIAFVVQGAAKKVALIEASGRASITYRRGWRWVGVEGPARVIDAARTPDGVELPDLLREIFSAAGGTHDDWGEFDRVMAAEGRVAVLVEPARIVGNRT
ncbi:MAG: pyridoxamine 5'-phosphate oxidase family protein [Acidimicrobiales bacterium]